MDKTEKIWMNGKLVDWADANIHVLSHTLHYGSGVFEGMRFYKTEQGPAVFRLNEHLQRLMKSASNMGIRIPYSRTQLKKAIMDSIRENNIEDGYIPPLVYYGNENLGLNPLGFTVSVAIAVWPWGLLLGEGAVKVKISKYIRIHPESTYAGAKICGNYVNSILATMEAKNEGYDEALLLDYMGNVAEGPGENIFIAEGDVLVTPGPGTILLGITRDSVMRIAPELGFKVKEEDISVERLKDAGEVFFTGTAAEVAPVVRIDDKVIGDGQPGRITRSLQQKYRDIIHGRDTAYSDWLSPVPDKPSLARSITQGSSWINCPMFSFSEE